MPSRGNATEMSAASSTRPVRLDRRFGQTRLARLIVLRWGAKLTNLCALRFAAPPQIGVAKTAWMLSKDVNFCGFPIIRRVGCTSGKFVQARYEARRETPDLSGGDTQARPAKDHGTEPSVTRPAMERGTAIPKKDALSRPGIQCHSLVTGCGRRALKVSCVRWLSFCEVGRASSWPG